MSWHPDHSQPLTSKQESLAEEYVSFDSDNAVPETMTLEVKRVAKANSVLQRTSKAVRTGASGTSCPWGTSASRDSAEEILEEQGQLRQV